MDNTTDISQEEWESLERYVLNNMTPEERTEFDTKLSADNSLQAKMAEMQLLLIGVNEAVLQEKLNMFHQGLSTEVKEYHIRRKPSSIKTWLIAASILLIAGISGWLLLYRETTDEKLFATYFKQDPGLITAMSATDNYAFEKAMIDYKKGDYKAAIHTWDSLQKGQPANDTLTYFLGVAQLANKNSKEAVTYLEKIPASSFFKADAQWYLGLALLKEGKKEEAKKAIQQSSHPDKDELLKKLK